MSYSTKRRRLLLAAAAAVCVAVSGTPWGAVAIAAPAQLPGDASNALFARPGDDEPSTTDSATTTIGELPLTTIVPVPGATVPTVPYVAPVPAPQPAPPPQPAPAPEPEPAPPPEPAPQPQPEPEPAPQPAPAPQPGPEPAPQPAPAPQPGPEPEPGPAPSEPTTPGAVDPAPPAETNPDTDTTDPGATTPPTDPPTTTDPETTPPTTTDPETTPDPGTTQPTTEPDPTSTDPDSADPDSADAEPTEAEAEAAAAEATEDEESEGAEESGDTTPTEGAAETFRTRPTESEDTPNPLGQGDDLTSLSFAADIVGGRASAFTAYVTLPPLCSIDAVPLEAHTYQVSSRFGLRGSEFHRGVDLAADFGTPIYSVFDGVVSAAGPAEGFGQWIVIDSDTPTGVVTTVFGHMEAEGVLVRAGDRVTAGQHIGYVASTGQSTGPHLHFEVWQGGRRVGVPVDPLPTLESARADGSPLVSVMGKVDNCGGAGAAPGTIPPEFVPWLRTGGEICEGVTPEVLAAQLEAENGFRHGPGTPVSIAGAQGPAQFMPGTWAYWGDDYDGNGVVDVNSIGDAVIAQARLMCENYSMSSQGIAQGTLTGDPVDLALAAYNAGFGAVQRAAGMPSGGEYTTQTQPYVRTIRVRAAAFAPLLTDPQAEIAAEPPVKAVASSES